MASAAASFPRLPFHERFTERLSKHVEAAAALAASRGAPQMRSEHLLVSMISESDPILVAAMKGMDVSLEKFRENLEGSIRSSATTAGNSPGCSVDIERAMHCSESLARHYGMPLISGEVVVLAMTVATTGSVPEILARTGIEAKALRSEILDLLGVTMERQPPADALKLA